MDGIMRSNIDLKRMRYVVEVARAEAITTAAQTLAITQSALSRSIAEVEEELGIKLFHRLPRGVQPTEAGKRFVARAQRLFGDIDDLVADVKDSKDLATGRLRIGIAPATYIGHTTTALRNLAAEHPGVAIEIVSGTPQSLCPRLLHGELNVIVGSSSYLKRWRELKLKTLAPMEVVCMFRRDHPIAALNEVTELDVLDYPLILAETVEPMYSDIAHRYIHHGLPMPQPQYVTDNFRLIREVVSVTDAFNLVMHPHASWFANLERDFYLLKGVVKLPPHEISVAYSPMFPITEVTERFEQLLVASLDRD